MDSAFRSVIPDSSLAAIAQLSENSRLGFATKNTTLHRGIEWSKSTLALGLPEWSGKTVLGPAVAANTGTTKQKPNLLTSTCSVDSNGQPTIVASYKTPGKMFPYAPSVSVAIPIAPAPGGHCVSGPNIGSSPTACYAVPGSGSCSVAYCAPNYVPVQFDAAPQPGSVQPVVGQKVCAQISFP